MDRLISKLIPHTTGTIFRCYMAAVLVAFAVMSLYTVPLTASVSIAEGIDDIFLSNGFWYGNFSLIGAGTLLFRSRLSEWKWGAWLGDVAAVSMFSFLSYEYLTSKPPIYAGGVMAILAVFFLIGGLINERRSP